MEYLAILKLLGSTIGLGLVQKHVIKKLPNSLIPYINVVIGSVLAPAFGLPPEVGAATGIGATGLHQTVKIPVKAVTGKSI